MKTGRLLKFVRPGAEIQAYIYRDGAVVHGTVYVVSRGTAELQAKENLRGSNEDGVEREIRAWIDKHYPKGT